MSLTMNKKSTRNLKGKKRGKKPSKASQSVNPVIKEAVEKTPEPKYIQKLLLKQVEELLALYTLPECKAISALVNARIDYLSSSIRPESHIDDLGLSFRAHSLLVRNKLLTVGKLLDFGLDNLFRLGGAGEKSIEEIKKAIGKMDPNS